MCVRVYMHICTYFVRTYVRTYIQVRLRRPIPCLSRIHPVPHSFPHLSILSFTHSPSLSLIPPVSHSLTLSLTHSHCLSLVHFVSPSLTLSLTHSHCLSLTHVVSHSFPPPLTRSFIDASAACARRVAGAGCQTQAAWLIYKLDNLIYPFWLNYSRAPAETRRCLARPLRDPA